MCLLAPLLFPKRALSDEQKAIVAENRREAIQRSAKRRLTTKSQASSVEPLSSSQKERIASSRQLAIQRITRHLPQEDKQEEDEEDVFGFNGMGPDEGHVW